MPEIHRPTCRCGRDRTHPLVHAERRYGFWAWLLLLSGATGTPKEIAFRCARCAKVIETSRDAATCREYRR